MAYDPVDIIVSPAWVFYAPVGEAPPADTVAFGGTWGGNWASLGYTTEPLSFSRNVELFGVDVQQSSTPLKQSRTTEEVQLATTLAEMNGVTLDMVLDGTLTTTAAGAGQVGKSEVAFGGKTTISEYAFGFEFERVLADNTRLAQRLFIYRATIDLNGDVSIAKGEVAGLPIVMNALADPDEDSGENIGLWQLITAEATS